MTIGLSEIMTGLIGTLLSAACFFIIGKIKDKSRKQKIASEIDVLSLRFSMQWICKQCEKDGYRTRIDTELFYDFYEIYTKQLNLNSYICQEVEPTFKKIEQK